MTDMDRLEALQAIRRINKEEFEDKIKPQGLPKERQDLLFEVIQGKIQVSYSSKPDIEDYALKSLMPEVYKSLPHDGHPYSSCELYEYDPPKNGQNIIKHGIGFGEVVSYSSQFGTLQVPCPDGSDGERRAIFSDLNLALAGNKLALPPSGIREVNYTISIVHYRDGRFRFISSRLMSSRREKYRKTMEQAFGEIIADELERKCFIDRCVEIVENDLIRPTSCSRPSAPTELIHRGMPTSAEPMWHPEDNRNIEVQGMACTPVKQRQWEIARSDSDRSRLYSQNYGPCSAFAGIDRENGWVFLCHFDTFRSVDAIDDLAEELRRLKTDFSQFELHTASSFWWPRTYLISALVSWFISWALFFLVVVLATAFSSTQLYLLWKIWKRKGFLFFPIHHGSFFYSRFWVMADADAQKIVAQRYSGKGEDGDFSSQKGAPWKAQKVRTRPPNAKQFVPEAPLTPGFYEAQELQSCRATANNSNGM